MRDETPVLSARSLAVSIDGRWVVDDLDIEIPSLQFVAIVGPNGAGKTTLLRAFAGLPPSFGELNIGGVPINDLDPRTRARAIAFLPQRHVFHWPMPVADIVATFRTAYPGLFGDGAAAPVTRFRQEAGEATGGGEADPATTA